MKKVFSLFIASVIACVLCAQTPEKMSYQAAIRNSSGQVLANRQVGMKISIIQNEVSGNVVYSETHTPTTNDNGLVGIEIGGGTVVAGSFAGIDWSKGPYFIKTETDPLGGSVYTISGTSELLSVPYALHAKTTEALPMLTDFQRNAILQPKEGLLIFNETTKNFNVYKNGNWYEWQATDCVPQPTIAMAGADQDVTPQITTTSLQANIPSSGTGVWSVVSGNGTAIADAYNPTSSFAGKNGAHTLRWTIATSCSSTSDEVTINIVDDCSNGVKDGTETDIDCGGTTCEKCIPQKRCLTHSDCSTGNCTNGTCRFCPVGMFYVPGNPSNPCVTQCPNFINDDTCVDRCPSNLLSFGKQCVLKCPIGYRSVNGVCVVSSNKINQK